MMSRKNYVQVANILNLHKEDLGEENFRNLVDEFSDYFQEDNPNFDFEKFAKACKK